MASHVLPTMLHQLNPVGTGYGCGRHFRRLKIAGAMYIETTDRLHLFKPRRPATVSSLYSDNVCPGQVKGRVYLIIHTKLNRPESKQIEVKLNTSIRVNNVII